MTSRQRLRFDHQVICRMDISPPESGYKCEKCGCKNGNQFVLMSIVDITLCPWHRQKIRGGGVDVHSYPRRMCKSEGECRV